MKFIWSESARSPDGCRVQTPSPATEFCSRDTFWRTFWISFTLARLLALTYRLLDYISVDFRRELDLEFSRSNMVFAISQPKMVWLPRNTNVTIGFDLGHDLKFEFTRSNMAFAVSQTKVVLGSGVEIYQMIRKIQESLLRPLACLCGPHRQMTIMLHICRPRGSDKIDLKWRLVFAFLRHLQSFRQKNGRMDEQMATIPYFLCFHTGRAGDGATGLSHTISPVPVINTIQQISIIQKNDCTIFWFLINVYIYIYISPESTEQ